MHWTPAQTAGTPADVARLYRVVYLWNVRIKTFLFCFVTNLVKFGYGFLAVGNHIMFCHITFKSCLDWIVGGRQFRQ